MDTNDHIDPVKRRNERFMELFHPALQRRLGQFARTLTHDFDTAKDLCSETILQALYAFDPDMATDQQTFKSFLFTIAYRLHVRDRQRRSLFESISHSLRHNPAWEGTQPDDSAEIRLLREAIQTLPQKYKLAIAHVKIADLNLDETARILNIKVTTVKTHVRRGMIILAKLLGIVADMSDLTTEKYTGPHAHEQIPPVHTEAPI